MLSFYLRNKTRIEKGNEIIFGKSNRIRRCTISIKGTGNKLILGDFANLKAVNIEIFGFNSTIKIGKNTVIGHDCYLSAKERNTELVIGDACMLSRNVKIMTSDGHDILDVHTLRRINPAKSIYIGNTVWIADGAVILKGCQIGDNTVIGLNSLVTKNIPPNTIAAGNPAKVVKEQSQWQKTLTF